MGKIKPPCWDKVMSTPKCTIRRTKTSEKLNSTSCGPRSAAGSTAGTQSTPAGIHHLSPAGPALHVQFQSSVSKAFETRERRRGANLNSHPLGTQQEFFHRILHAAGALTCISSSRTLNSILCQPRKAGLKNYKLCFHHWTEVCGTRKFL